MPLRFRPCKVPEWLIGACPLPYFYSRASSALQKHHDSRGAELRSAQTREPSKLDPTSGASSALPRPTCTRGIANQIVMPQKSDWRQERNSQPCRESIARVCRGNIHFTGSAFGKETQANGNPELPTASDAQSPVCRLCTQLIQAEGSAFGVLGLRCRRCRCDSERCCILRVDFDGVVGGT